MARERLYEVFVKIAGEPNQSYESCGFFHGRNKREAIDNFKDKSRLNPQDFFYSAQEITLQGFRITLTPLEQKASSE